MRNSLLLLIVACSALRGDAQPFHREVSSIPVSVDGAALALPFAGGINTPNHQFVDIDGDGDPDLFIFDDDLHVDFYRNDGTPSAPRFVLAPHEITLPLFHTWFVFVDYDGDGLPDLATDDSAGTGVALYHNTGTAGAPAFTLAAARLADSSGNPVIGAPIGIPAFTDLTGDGLPDFLSSNLLNGSFNYYRNVGTGEAPLLQFVTDHLDNILVLGDSCLTGAAAPPGAAEAALHGGAALHFADLTRSGKDDLYYGDLFSHGVFRMTNSGTPSDPHLACSTNRFPDSSLVTFGFNEASFVDIDADGDLDLFVGVLNNMLQHGFRYYENAGDSLAPLFIRRTDDYLSMLDAGENSSPAIADIDGDGLPDLVVGADESKGGVLWYFRNTGTPRSPSFALADTLFAAGAFAGRLPGNTYAPAVADLNGDGLPDLAVGEFSGAVGIHLNAGAPGAPVYDTAAAHVIRIAAGPYNASPAFADIDGDGDLDLFVGRSNGSIAFYLNDGDPAHPHFTLAEPAYAGIAAGENAKPLLYDLDGDGDADLLVGNASGAVLWYENTGTRDSAAFTFRSGNYGATDPMANAAPAVADIDGDGDPDLFTGNLKGGLHFYRNGPVSAAVPGGGPALPRAFALRGNFPNPFNPSTRIDYTLDRRADVTLAVFDLLGREAATLVRGVQHAGAHSAFWRAVDFPSGVYYYRLTAGGFSAVGRMLHIR